MKNLFRSSILTAITLTAATMLTTSCIKDSMFEDPTPAQPVEEATNPFEISEEQALDNMYNMMDQIYGPGTRASSRVAVSIEPITVGDLSAAATRAGLSSSTFSSTSLSTVAYTANFSNNQGFAVLAADTRLKSPVLAITESGSLSSSTLQNAVTKAATEKITEITGGTLGSQNDPLIYIPPTPDYITAEMLAKMMMDIVMPKPIYDEDGNLIGWDTNIPGKMEEFYYPAIPLNSDGSQMYPMNVSIGSPSSSYKHVVAPMLKTHWHQYAPFYNNCYTIGGSQALTGCVAIALAQMIAANEHPYWPSTVAKDKSVTSSWADLKSYDSDPLSWYQLSTTPEYRARVESDMAKVIRAIGDGVLTIYGSSGSDAVASSAAAYMDVMKEYEALWVDYNWTDIDNMLRNRLPVFISGYRNILSGGHAWVIDGMIQYTTTVLTQKWGLEYVKGKGYKRVKIGEPFHVTEEYGDCLLHCNWGGGGTSDGYYYSKAFNASAGPVRKEAGLDTVTYTDGSDYNDNLTLIRYERK